MQASCTHGRYRSVTKLSKCDNSRRGTFLHLCEPGGQRTHSDAPGEPPAHPVVCHNHLSAVVRFDPTERRCTESCAARHAAESAAAALGAWQRCVWWCSCVLHVAVHAHCTQSTRPPHSTSGRWRHQAGAEQAALSTELHCRVRHSHPTLSSLDRQEEHHHAHTRLACGGAGQRWFFLRQSCNRAG